MRNTSFSLQRVFLHDRLDSHSQTSLIQTELMLKDENNCCLATTDKLFEPELVPSPIQDLRKLQGLATRNPRLSQSLLSPQDIRQQTRMMLHEPTKYSLPANCASLGSYKPKFSSCAYDGSMPPVRNKTDGWLPETDIHLPHSSHSTISASTRVKSEFYNSRFFPQRKLILLGNFYF